MLEVIGQGGLHKMSIGVTDCVKYNMLRRRVKVTVSPYKAIHSLLWGNEYVFYGNNNMLMKFFSSRWGIRNRFTERCHTRLTSST